MNRQETAKIVGVLMGYYPDTFKAMSDEQMKMFVEIWAKSFEDEPYSTVSLAVWDFIQNSTDDFMPRVGKIKAIITEHKFENEPNEMEAFEILIKARKKYNAYSHSYDNDSYSSLPETIKRAIGGRTGFVSIGTLNYESDSYSVEKSHFMNQYRQEVEKEKRNSKRPQWLEKAIKDNTLLLESKNAEKVKGLIDGSKDE
jgi:hypothetical protein